MIQPTHTVAETVLDHSVCAEVFQRHRIDFCCRGERSIDEAARDRGLDVDALLTELTAAISARQGHRGTDPRTLSTRALVDHIVGVHHDYLKKAMPFIEQIAAKVARVHGPGNPDLVTLSAAVGRLAETLVPHLGEEEEHLFPALLARAPDPERIAGKVDQMKDEHTAVSVLLEEIRLAANGFVHPPEACNSYRTLFNELAQLEKDLFTHVHLENHVLAPRFTMRMPASGIDGAEATRTWSSVSDYLGWDHDRLDTLLETAVAAAKTGDLPGVAEPFEAFRTGLIRHIELEEAVLFPRFEAIAGPAGGGPVAVMFMEHQAIKVELGAAAEALAKGDADAFQENVARMVGVLGPHNQKEESIIYPTTDQGLPADERPTFVAGLVQR